MKHKIGQNAVVLHYIYSKGRALCPSRRACSVTEPAPRGLPLEAGLRISPRRVRLLGESALEILEKLQ